MFITVTDKMVRFNPQNYKVYILWLIFKKKANLMSLNLNLSKLIPVACQYFFIICLFVFLVTIINGFSYLFLFGQKGIKAFLFTIIIENLLVPNFPYQMKLKIRGMKKRIYIYIYKGA